jgi:hypothetical protein
MKKAILAALSLAGAASAYGQGQISIDNLIGSTIVPILGADGAKLAGANYSVDVLRYDASAADKFGAQLGTTIVGIGSNNRFRITTGPTTVDGVLPGNTVGLIVRAWDNTGGASYADSKLKGASQNWTSQPLGGIDANNAIIITPKLNGFASFSLAGTGGTVQTTVTSGVTTTVTTTVTTGVTTTVTSGVVPEPSTIALGALGAAALVLRRRK